MVLIHERLNRGHTGLEVRIAVGNSLFGQTNQVCKEYHVLVFNLVNCQHHGLKLLPHSLERFPTYNRDPFLDCGSFGHIRWGRFGERLPFNAQLQQLLDE